MKHEISTAPDMYAHTPVILAEGISRYQAYTEEKALDIPHDVWICNRTTYGTEMNLNLRNKYIKRINGQALPGVHPTLSRLTDSIPAMVIVADQGMYPA
jgi:hypothetical protein